MDIKSIITLKEFRAASYFGLFMRISKFIKTFIVFAIATLVYLILGKLEVLPYYNVGTWICLFYILSFLWIFGSTDRKVLKYAKSEGSLIGIEMIYHFDDRFITLFIPKTNEKNTLTTENIPGVFETQFVFMVYLNSQQTLIISKSSLNNEQLSYLRNYFAVHLKSRFASKSFSNSLKGLSSKKGLF